MKRLYTESYVSDIAEAIREKNGTDTAYTIAQMGDAVRAISGTGETIEYSQMNDIVAQFIDEVTYDPSDYTASSIADYAGQSVSYDASKPCGVTVNVPAGRLVVADSYSGLVAESEAAAGDNAIYNAIPSEQGAVYALITDGKEKQGGCLLPTGQVRMIQCETANVRDLGGWACDGGTVKYGKLFRGGEFKEADLDVFLNQLGIRHELNLRGADEGAGEVTSLRDHVGYTCPAKYVWYTISDTTTWREILRCAFDCVTEGRPLFFHCSAGADRTGTVACILEAILGMSQSDIDKDYELTCFKTGVATDNAARRRNESEWSGLISQINAKSGDTFRDKVINWVATMGFMADEINAYRAAMIDGAPETIALDVDTYTVTNTLTNVTSDNSATSATQYQPYEAEITVADGYAIESVSVTMGGVDVTSTVFSGTKTNYNHAVTLNLTGCTSSNARKATMSGQAYVAFITADTEFTLDGATVSITMGGVDMTQYYSDGKIAIPSVTGDLVITIEAVSSADETIPITWLAETTCTYTVGSACTVSASANYTITEEIPVEYGKTYTTTITTNSSAGTQVKWVGVNSSGVVTEAVNSAAMTVGTYEVSWTPTNANTVGVRIRGYTGLDVSAATKLVVS